MYRIGYIDDEPVQYENFAKKIRRRYPDMELVLLKDCKTKQDFVEKIYEEQADVLLIDFKMVKSYGFNGTTLISYLNDQIRDLECFILTAVDTEQVDDGLVAARDKYSKTVFDTEADDPVKLAQLDAFVGVLRESAEVFRNRRTQKVERYRELLEKKKQGKLGVEEEEFLILYKVLSSYGMVEKLPDNLLASAFEKKLDNLLTIGEAIIEKNKNHQENTD